MNPTNQVKEILLAAPRYAARLFRRNVGMAWVGDALRISAGGMIRVEAGDVVIRQARPFNAGVKGQYDTYGWQEVTITADMVGQKFARYVEIEAKQGSGRESPEQIAWGNAVRHAGGKAGVARTIEDMGRILGY